MGYILIPIISKKTRNILVWDKVVPFQFLSLSLSPLFAYYLSFLILPLKLIIFNSLFAVKDYIMSGKGISTIL